MCLWKTLEYSCGHHETSTEMCRIKARAAARDEPFIHTINCQLLDSHAVQPRSCPLCTSKIQATISQGQQPPHVLGQDPRDTLPSQAGKRATGAAESRPRPQPRPLAPQPPPLIANILKKKRQNKIWQGTTQATAVEWARLRALSDKEEDPIFPADGRVLEEDGQIWLTADAHQKMHERSNPQRADLQNHLRAKGQSQSTTLRESYRAAEPDKQTNSTLRGKRLPSALARAQQRSELVEEQEEVQKIPSCLVPGGGPK